MPLTTSKYEVMYYCDIITNKISGPQDNVRLNFPRLKISVSRKSKKKRNDLDDIHSE